MSDTDFDALLTISTPVVFAVHGDPSLVHRLIYRRANRNMHVHGYNEKGSITTRFDMRVQNGPNRFHRVQKVVACLPPLGSVGSDLLQAKRQKLIQHKLHSGEQGEDLPEIGNWTWAGARAAAAPGAAAAYTKPV